MATFVKKKSIPRSVETDAGILSASSAWPVQEAYKALRTNITFSMPGSGCKVIGISSAFAHDGKSINAVNMAIAFGQIGKKVLLMDCDLRLSTCASKLGIPGVPGLSDILVGEVQFNEALHKSEKHGIHVLPAGNIPPDPTWLLQSDQMKTLIELMKRYYDYIFIDLPPVTTVADASIMSKYIDGFLLVVRHQVTELRAINDAIAQLKFADAKIIGFVYNDVTQEGHRYYRHYYKNYYREYEKGAAGKKQ